MKKSILILSVVLAMAISLVGCANEDTPKLNGDDQPTTFTSEQVSEPETKPIPESFMVTTENYFDYQPGLECAAFSSSYVLRHYGEDIKGLKLFETFPGKLDGGGVMPSGIETMFVEREYNAEFKLDGTVEGLKKLVSKGAPVIVFIHVEEPYTTSHNTHYIPVVGYDEEYIYFAESLDYLANCKDEKDVAYNRKTEIAKFERLWSNIDGVWEKPYFAVEKK